MSYALAMARVQLSLFASRPRSMTPALEDLVAHAVPGQSRAFRAELSVPRDPARGYPHHDWTLPSSPVSRTRREQHRMTGT